MEKNIPDFMRPVVRYGEKHKTCKYTIVGSMDESTFFVKELYKTTSLQMLMRFLKRHEIYIYSIECEAFVQEGKNKKKVFREFLM